jgi:hypothetical protein
MLYSSLAYIGLVGYSIIFTSYEEYIFYPWNFSFFF